MDGIGRSRGWDKEIPRGVLPMEQLVLSDKWARKICPTSLPLSDKRNYYEISHVRLITNARYAHATFLAHDCIPTKTKVELLTLKKNVNVEISAI